MTLLEVSTAGVYQGTLNQSVMWEEEPKWGPTGKPVFERSYSREKADGRKENWREAIERVVDGNLGLVSKQYHEVGEREKLIRLFFNFQAIPGGRHLWMSGVPGRQFLFNCHHAHWDPEEIDAHYAFTFDQLMQGGGVGANYSNEFVLQYPAVRTPIGLHIVCDAEHPDYEEVKPYLSTEYSSKYGGWLRIEDSREGWIEALSLLLNASFDEKLGDTSDLVFDVSLIRHRGSPIRTFGGTAAGPTPLVIMLTEVAAILRARALARMQLTSLDHMLIDHHIANCVVSGNVRRSARMSIKNWADPDILDFIHCKQNFNTHWSTNISVEIDDHFFRALRYRDQHATDVYAAVVEGMLKNGEPGFYNRSLAQVGEIGQVASTNPCGEIALEPWENCNLGHVNLDAFYDDFSGACEAHRLMARFLLRATFGDVPHPKQREVVNRNRRIGVGHFGFQGWLAKQGIRFSDSHRNAYVRKTLHDFYEVVRKESDRYAFQLRIPAPVKCTTIAPTGTIAKMPGKTEGAHPLYGRYFIRRVRFSTVDPTQQRQLEEFARLGHHIEDCIYTPNTKVVEFITKDILVSEVEALGIDPEQVVEAANEIDIADMLAVQVMYQEAYCDNAISFTINVEPDTHRVEDVMGVLIHYLPKLKGTTLMVDASRPQAPYSRISRHEYEMATSQSVGDAIDESCANGACPIR